MQVKKYPNCYVYASGWSWLHNIYATVHAPDSSSEFYLIEENDGYCRFESVKYSGRFLGTTGKTINLYHTSAVEDSRLFLITSKEDGYMNIECKKEHGCSICIPWFFNFPVVPHLVRSKDLDCATWKLEAAHGITEEVFHQDIQPTGPGLPREQHLKTADRDVIHVVSYSLPPDDKTIEDVDHCPLDRPRAQQLIANGCMFGKYIKCCIMTVAYKYRVTCLLLCTEHRNLHICPRPTFLALLT